jgi:hypothetical protein
MFDEERLPLAGPPSAPGEHNRQVYGDWLGLDQAGLELLFAGKVI